MKTYIAEIYERFIKVHERGTYMTKTMELTIKAENREKAYEEAVNRGNVLCGDEIVLREDKINE